MIALAPMLSLTQLYQTQLRYFITIPPSRIYQLILRYLPGILLSYSDRLINFPRSCSSNLSHVAALSRISSIWWLYDNLNGSLYNDLLYDNYRGWLTTERASSIRLPVINLLFIHLFLNMQKTILSLSDILITILQLKENNPIYLLV